MNCFMIDFVHEMQQLTFSDYVAMSTMSVEGILKTAVEDAYDEASPKGMNWQSVPTIT